MNEDTKIAFMQERINVNEETKMALMQERVKNLETNVEKILSNHLPHIQDEIKGVQEEIVKLRITVARYGAIVIGAVAVLDVIIKVIPIK